MAQDRVITDSSHGNHHVGVGQQPVQINAPAFFGRGEISQLAAIPGVMNDQRGAWNRRTVRARSFSRGRKHRKTVGLDTGVPQSLPEHLQNRPGMRDRGVHGDDDSIARHNHLAERREFPGRFESIAKRFDRLRRSIPPARSRLRQRTRLGARSPAVRPEN